MSEAAAPGERASPPPRRRRALGRLVRALAGLVWLGGLTGALGLALLRQTDPHAPRLVELISFTPVGLLGAALALGAVPIVARRRRGRLALGLPAAALCAVHGVWLAPLYTGSVPAAAPSACAVTVMTQNLEQGDLGSLGRIVDAEAVEVLVVVEASPGLAEAARAELAARFPHSAGVVKGRWSNAVVLSRHPLLVRASSADARSTAVRVDTPCLGELDVLAIHPSPPYGPSWRSDYEQIQAFVSAQAGQRLRTAPARVVALGDLNATLDHAPLRRLLELGLRDAAEATNAGWMPTYPAPGTTRRAGIPVPPLVPIDRVLVGAGLAVTDLRTVTVADADHLGVVARLAARAD